METIEQQFNNLNLLRLFEIEVIDKRTKEKDYIIFEIEIHNKSFFVYHVALEKVDKFKVPHFFRLIKPDETLDNHLQELYEDCISLIINSEFYELN